MIKYFLLIILLANGLCFSAYSQAQSSPPEWGVGIAGAYDFQTKGKAAEVLGDFHFTERMSVLPEITYYFPFNPIHELYAGLTLRYYFPIFTGWSPYLSASALYNDWMNASEYSHGTLKPNNFAPEGGIGIVRSRGCLRPFVEGRYDTKWKEANVRVGVLMFFKTCDCFHKENCPAYNED